MHDQVAAGLDVITDGEQTPPRLQPLVLRLPRGHRARAARRRGASARRRTTSAAATAIIGELAAPARPRRRRGVGAPAAARACRPGAEGERARPVHAERPPRARTPTTPTAERSPRRCCRSCAPSSTRSSTAGCEEITVDEPSMSCYAHREDPARFVDVFNRTVEPVVGRVPARRRTSASATTRAAPSGRGGTRRCSPRSSSSRVDEIHVEMASRELAELEVVAQIAERARRRRRHRRREELLDRAAGGGRRARAPLPALRARRAARRSHRTAGCPRPRAGRRGRSSRTSSRACAIVRKELDAVIEPALADDAFLADVARRTAGDAPLVARPERLPAQARRPLPAARPVPLGLADREVRRDRDAARADDAPRRRPGAARLRGRRASGHGHTDHLDPETLPALVPARSFALPDCGDLALERAGVVPQVVDVDETVAVAASASRLCARRPRRPWRGRRLGRRNCGRWTLYHSGDTAAYAGLGQRLPPVCARRRPRPPADQRSARKHGRR